MINHFVSFTLLFLFSSLIEQNNSAVLRYEAKSAQEDPRINFLVKQARQKIVEQKPEYSPADIVSVNGAALYTVNDLNPATDITHYSASLYFTIQVGLQMMENLYNCSAQVELGAYSSKVKVSYESAKLESFECSKA